MFFSSRKRRRAKLREQPMPDAWREIITRNVPYAHALGAEQRRELERHALILLHEKRFEGCGGLELTDEIRVTIAAQAAVLLLNRPTDYFPKLSAILVYPARYVVETTRRLPSGLIVQSEEWRSGESWYRGAVVLSWDDALHGAFDANDGHNLVLHEFAHQLDSESGDVNGAPPLPDREARAAWAAVMSQAFDRLRAALQQGRRAVVRPYAATNPAEFFAVLTETFFEQPRALRAEWPDVYAQLAAYYRQDPADHVASSSQRL